MTVENLIEQLAKGELDADEFNSRVEQEAQAAAREAAKDAAGEARARDIAVEERVAAVIPERVELSPEEQRELEESKDRIKNAADKARHI